MAKNAFPAMKTGGGVVSKMAWLLVILAVLMLLIKNPTESAGWVSGAFHLAIGAVDGIAAFLRSLFG